MKELQETIYELEYSLLQPEVRTSTEKLDALLHDNFREVGSSGEEYNKESILERLPASEHPTYNISDFRVELLADGAALSTFKVEREESGEIVAVSLRSSVWKNEEGGWKMIYHQGTPATEQK